MAVRFDAASDRISYVGGAGDPPETFTVTMWVYLSAGLGDYTSLFRRYTAGGSGRGQIGTDTDGLSLMWWPTGIPFGYSMTVGEWCRVAVVVSGGTVTTYAADETGSAVVNTGSPGTVAGANQITLAGVSVGSGAEWINGRQAYDRVWAAALTQAEIEAEWASPVPVRTAGLWADWPLETAADLTDHSGNGRHLTAGSTPVTTEDGPPVADPPLELLLLAARSASRASTPTLAQLSDVGVLGARAAARSTRPLVAQTSSLTVRTSRAAARSSRPVLAQLAELVVVSARSVSRAAPVVLGQAFVLLVDRARSTARAGAPTASQLSTLLVRSARSAARARRLFLGERPTAPKRRTFVVPADVRVAPVAHEARTLSAHL